MNKFLDIARQYGTPVYVTNAPKLREKTNNLIDAFNNINVKIFYAIKANYNPSIVRILKNAGVYGIDAVSPFEVQHALNLGFKNEEIIFTGTSVTEAEMIFLEERHILQNIGSLSELRRFARLFPKKNVSLRINLDIGVGECDKINTGTEDCKFGLLLEWLDEAKKIVHDAQLCVVGLHCHIGSGLYDPEIFRQVVEKLCNIATDFSDITFLDFGGGFGVSYKPDQISIDLTQFTQVMIHPIQQLKKILNKNIDVYFEPGKYLVAESTELIVQVTTVEERVGIKYVGVNSGMNHLIRPTLYDAYHHITNLSHPDGALEKVRVVGNICETGDILGDNIAISTVHEGDILAIHTAGAYGSSMSSNYNMRPFATEIIIDGEKMMLTRKRQSYEDMIENF